jgi:serine protease Do
MRSVPALLLALLLVPPAVYAQPDDARALSEMSRQAEQLSESVREAVVQIKVQRVVGLQGLGAGSTRPSERRGSGSGFFVDESEYVVTNAHVVDGAQEVWVQRASPPPPAPGEASILRESGRHLRASVVGIDRETDVALLKVPGSRYPTLSFGNSDRLHRGQVVFAFGGPMGLENTMTMGIVSATARQFEEGDPMIYVQTDAPINPGSSGGPLVNAEGEVVGLNTLNVTKSGGSQGLGFAGPSNIVKYVVQQLREHGTVRRGVIGAHAQTIGPELAEALDLSRSYRVVLSDVYPGSPAEQAGLRPGDVITHLNGERMHNGHELDVNLYPELGSIATLSVVRGDSTFETGVRVVRERDASSQFSGTVDPSKHLVSRFGILGLPLREETSPRGAFRRLPSGVVVFSSNRPPAPWGDQLRRGDVIYTVQGQRVAGPDELRSVLDGRGTDRVVAHVYREGRLEYLVLPIE